MNFFRALLDSQFSEAPALKPRVPALFEPLAPRVDPSPFEETVEVEKPSPGEIPQRAASQMLSHEIPRAGEPYRGVMNIPLSPHTAHADTPPSWQNTPPRVVKVLTQDAREPQDERTPHETTGEPQFARAALVPAQISQVQARESLDEKNQDAQAQSAPVVRVNIGRIVVRAMPGTEQRSPASGRAAEPSKKMSLDDYLNKRERGER